MFHYVVMSTLETELQRVKQCVLEREEQLIARINLVAHLASKGIDTTEAEHRLKSLRETVDFLYEVLEHHEDMEETLQLSFR